MRRKGKRLVGSMDGLRVITIFNRTPNIFSTPGRTKLLEEVIQ
jgi:hypothetical protein